MARTKAHPNQINPSVIQDVANTAAVRAAGFNAVSTTISVGGADGGLFARDASDTTSAEDGGSAAGTIIRGTDYATKGVWKRVFDGSVNLLWFGASRTGLVDASTAIGLAVTYALANNAELFCPEGDYLMLGAVEKSGATLKMKLKGEGTGLTRFFIDNPTGGILLTCSNRSAEINLTDCEFMARRKGAGTGFKISQPEGGNQHKRTAIVRNVKFSVINENDTVNYGHFTKALDLSGSWHALCENVYVIGPWGNGISNNYTDSSAAYQTEVGIDLSLAYGPDVHFCTIDGVATAIRATSSANPGPEHFRMSNCQLVSVLIALDFSRPAPEPTLWINNCHINFRNYGFKIDGAKLVNIYGNYPYNQDTASEFAFPNDILLTNTQFVQIHHNGFHYDGNPNRICVSVSATVLAADIHISDNEFSCVAAVGIDLGTFVDNASIMNNAYPGTVTIPVRDRSGAAVRAEPGGQSRYVQTLEEGGVIQGPMLELYRLKETQPSASTIGGIIATANNTSDVKIDYGTFRARVVDSTAGTEGSSWGAFIYEAGSSELGLEIDGGAVTTSQTAVLIRTNRAGTKAIQRVELGAADSGGAGYRMLRVAN